MARTLAVAVAAAPRSAVEGRFERHASLNRRELTGSLSGGRWGPPGLYSVLYLGRPRASVTIEAYRHLVDPYVDAGMTGDAVAPRRVLTCEVSVSNVLDLRDPTSLPPLGLADNDLMSDVDDYDACWRVAKVAHQLELHGVIAPAATGVGETLALFERYLPAAELPVLVGDEVWDRLPADPRRLRIVDEESSA